jgi:dUTPase
MKLFVKKIAGLVLPAQATNKDAGYDVLATSGPNIVGEKIDLPLEGVYAWKRVAYVEYGTNLFVAPQEEEQVVWKSLPWSGGAIDWTTIGVDYHTQLFPRSSISRYNLVLANSVATIDNGYRNQILVRFKYLFQPEDFVIVPEAGMMKVYGRINPEHLYNVGEKMVQIKAAPNIPIEFEEIENLNTTERGLGGFGSSGK